MDKKISFIGIFPPVTAHRVFLGNRGRQVAKVLGDAVVATDDSRILKEVERFGGRAVMTSESHRSGTDRCFEAYRNCGSTADVIINIQGDEPFIHEQQIEEIMQCFNDDDTQIATPRT